VSAQRQRAVAEMGSRPVLPAYVRLRRDEVRGRWVALAPERVVELDERSLDILKLCDGSRSIAELAGELAKSYDAPEAAIAEDVLAFIQEWSDKLLVRLET